VRRELRDARIGFEVVGAQTHPAGSLAAVVARAANPGGPIGLRRVILDVAASTDMFCREAPAVLRRLGVQAVVADQMEAGGGMVAEALGLPFVSVACALPVNREPALPLPVMPFGYATDAAALHRNDVSARIYDWLMSPHGAVIERQAGALGIAPRKTLADCVSPLLQLSQTTRGFDFPRAAAPLQLHHIGPLRPPASQEPTFDLELRPGRPFVFASLGTLQGGRFGLFKRIARACAAIDAQLLIAHCDRLSSAQADALRRIGSTLVCGFAPQRATLARADAAITHAGINTVMDALVAGTPMLCLPIAFDQPGTAARVVHSGSGLRLLPIVASAHSMARDLRRLLDEPVFAERAAALGREVETSGGTTRAADLIEAALGVSAPPTPTSRSAKAHHADA
jgi:zeaxanthin glucosyltransferase